MSCNHYEETSRYIQKILEEVYPTIQYQLIMIGSHSNFENAYFRDPFISELYVLINELRSVFHALITYETTLVFPSVLKYFDNNGIAKDGQLPDVAELQSMTKSKERHILKLCDNIDIHLKKADISALPQQENIALIVSFFQSEFKKNKEQWNRMLNNRMSNCACFRSM